MVQLGRQEGHRLLSFDHLKIAFPGLIIEGFAPTSPATSNYNCIAWAVHIQDDWWWPFGTPMGSSKESFWPRLVPKKITIKAFIKAFETKGFRHIPNRNSSPEVGFEKIAIYSLGTKPTHAARQLPDGTWTHKLGSDIDITANLSALEGTSYGTVYCIMKKIIN
jgi:hypothetical protein